MARLNRMAEPMRSHLAKLPCPSFKTHPWAEGPALEHRRVSIVSTAGLHRRGDRPFEEMTGDYRHVPDNHIIKPEPAHQSYILEELFLYACGIRVEGTRHRFPQEGRHQLRVDLNFEERNTRRLDLPQECLPEPFKIGVGCREIIQMHPVPPDMRIMKNGTETTRYKTYLCFRSRSWLRLLFCDFLRGCHRLFFFPAFFFSITRSGLKDLTAVPAFHISEFLISDSSLSSFFL